jgi:hypothetical protein
VPGVHEFISDNSQTIQTKHLLLATNLIHLILQVLVFFCAVVHTPCLTLHHIVQLHSLIQLLLQLVAAALGGTQACLNGMQLGLELLCM